MIKKVYKKEISVLLVLYLIVLKYLIKNQQESAFTLYLLYLITSFSTQKEIKSQVRSKKTPDNVKMDFGICGKVPINKGKTANLRSGRYYYNARWYDPNLGRFITEDPIKDGSNWFIYTSNNPLNFTDPTGLKQTLFQKALTSIISAIANSSPKAEAFIQKNTNVEITRGVYKGIEITDSWPSYDYEGTEAYYQDDLSVEVFGIPLNDIQVQSTADHPAGPDDTMENGRNSKAEVGVSGATKAYISDTLLFDDTGNFLHEVWSEGRKPGSQGCPVTQTDADEREVMDILREDLNFSNGGTVDYSVNEYNGSKKDNLD